MVYLDLNHQLYLLHFRKKSFLIISNRVQKYLDKKTPIGYKSVINVSISDEKDYVVSNVIISLQKK